MKESQLTTDLLKSPPRNPRQSSSIIIIKVFINNSLRKQTCSNLHGNKMNLKESEKIHKENDLLVTINPLSPKSDQHQISPCNVNAL